MVQNHVSVNGNKERFFEQGNTETAGIKRYEPVWALMRKLRKTMGKRDACYKLEGMIEMSKGKCGREAAGKFNVAVMVELPQIEDIETGENTSLVLTDDNTSNVDIADYVELHISEKSSKELARETLRWIHFTISNAKRNLLGNYHKINGKYLQLYFNEFVYKLNRRYFWDKLFDSS